MTREQDSINAHPLDSFIDEQAANEGQIIQQTKQFSPEEQKKIEELSSSITPMDHDGLLNFGTEAQSNMSQFSHRILNDVKTSDIGPVGDSLNGLMAKLNQLIQMN